MPSPDTDPRFLLASILQLSLDAIIEIDHRYQVTSINPATERMFGFKPDELIGKSILTLVPALGDDQGRPHRQERDNTERFSNTSVRREAIGRRSDGSLFPVWLLVGGRPLPSDLPSIVMIRDISKAKEFEHPCEKLQLVQERQIGEPIGDPHDGSVEGAQRNKLTLIEQVAGGIAHEIRNPLNAIRTSAYLLLQGEAPVDEYTRAHLLKIDRQISLIDSVIVAMAEFAKLSTPMREPIDLHRLIINTLQELEIPAGVALDNQLSDSLPRVIADGNQMTIVFRNLISNALDAMPRGGKLTLSATQPERLVVVHVSDLGMGFHPADFTRLAEPFFTTKPSGMGMGLAITKAIVERNGGTVVVNSKLGSGTTFSIGLAAADRPDATAF